jgi:hypothetical protein
MHLLSISPLQLLDLWDQLTSAEANANRYGGDVAEIYIHRVMPHNPGHALSDRHRDSLRAACNTLHSVFRLFEERHDVIVEFESGENIDDLRDMDEPFGHRIHVRVRPKTE